MLQVMLTVPFQARCGSIVQYNHFIGVYIDVMNQSPLGLDNEVTLYRVYTRELNGELCTE